MEEEPEWAQPRGCRTKAADEGTAASSGLWVSLRAATRVSRVLCPWRWGRHMEAPVVDSCAHQAAQRSPKGGEQREKLRQRV